MRVIAAALAVTLMSATAVLAQPAPYAPIPPLQAEPGEPPPRPGPPERFVLEPGHWHWNGFRYVWIGRHWIELRPGYGHFIHGHWVVGAYGGAHWIPGHWVP